jgi:hypothetical protein
MTSTNWSACPARRVSRVRSRIVDELFAVLECTSAPLMACRPRGFELDVHESDPAVTRSGGSIAGSPTGPLRSVHAGQTQAAAR